MSIIWITILKSLLASTFQRIELAQRILWFVFERNDELLLGTCGDLFVLQIKLGEGIELFSLVVLKQVDVVFDMADAILRGVPCSST